MTVALYCRVSTDEQAEHGFSIEDQQERLKAFAVSQGWTDYELYVDDGYSGTSLERPAMKRLLYHAQAGHIKAICVYRLDRLSRRQKDVLYLLEDIFEKHSIAFKSVTESFDTSTPFGKAMLGILAVFAQLERETIIERTTSGRRRRVHKGLWYGGRIPFGYEWDKENQRLLVVPDQAHIVRTIYRKYLEGESYNSIAEWAESQTNDRKFDHGVIRDMLMRPIYTGRMNNAGTLVDGQHEAIIEMPTWERVQREMANRAERRTPAGDYLLSGLIRCGLCGAPGIHIVMHQRRKHTYYYYVCKAHHVRPKNSKTPMCTMDAKNQFKLEASVVEKLMNLALDPRSIEAELKQQQTEVNNSLEVVEDIEAKIKEVDRKLEVWYDNLEDESLDQDRVKRRITSLEDEKKRLLRRFSEIDVPSAQNKESLMDSFKLLRNLWNYATLAEQQAMLRALVKQIVIHPKTFDVSFVWNV